MERRKFERIAIKSVAELNMLATGEELFAFVGGVSRGGLEIYCQQPLAVGKVVRVRLTFLNRQGEEAQELLEGAIRWCSKLGEAHIAGLEFSAPIKERDHPALWSYLQHEGTIPSK